MTNNVEIRKRIIALLDTPGPVGYREFLEEVAEDVRARIECLEEEQEDD